MTASKPKRIWRVLRWIAAVLIALVLALVITLVSLHEPLPEGRPGPAADALAHRIERAVNRDAWERTKAVRFRWADRDDHLWDRERELSRVRWDDVEVLQRLDRREGVATENGQPVTDPERRRELVEEAWARFCNDTFWLNPFAKLFDSGTERSIVTIDGNEALLIRYTSGGVTPGDSYLWIPGAGDRPKAGKMWVSILPIGGIDTTWQRWVSLSTGAKISTLHHLGPLTLELTDVAGSATLAELEPGPDPFAALVQ